MRLQVTWFIYLVFCSSIVFGKNKNVRNMILSYVTSEGRPSHVLTPNLCWENSEQIALSKSLNTVNLNAARSLQRNRTMYQTVNTLVLVDMTCEGSRDLLLAANKLSMFKSPFRWLLLDFDPSHDDVLDLLDILVDSNVVTAKAVGDQEYSFTEVYKVAPNQEVISTACCSWKSQIHSPALVPTTSIRNSNAIVKSTFTSKFGTIEDYRHTRMLSPRRLNLRRHVLTMVNVITDSNDTRRHMGDRLKLHQDSITKMSYMVVSICFEMLNATENLIFTHTWGYKDKSGNWQGIIDHLLKKEADLGTLTIFTQERMEVIDYIAMVGSTAVRFVFREPPLAYLSNIFTLPFTGAVWLAIFVCVMSCAVFLFIASKWEATMDMHPFQLDGSWADVLILIIGAVLQQGCTLEPRHAAGRCVTLLLFVALTILYAAYSANIVVLLRAPSSSVRTLSDVLNSPLKIGASDFEYNRYFFKKLNEPIRKEIYDKKIAPKGKKPNFYTMEEGVERIRKGLFAFHMELNPGYRLIQETYQEDEKCDLVEIDYINEIDPWVPGQKNSPFKDLFRMNFIKIRESGIQAAVHQRLQVPKPRCSGSVNTFSSVGIADMYPAMLATLYGMLLAPAVLLLEILYHRVLTARQKRQKRESTHFN